MSHFTVLVIGENPEAQLAPFHEFECTSENNQYVVDVDVTEETREKGLGYHGLGTRVVDDESEVDREGAHKYGYAVIKNGVLVKAVNRTNPNAKWDWYVLGGRYTGFFKLKPGFSGETGTPGLMTEPATSGWVDQARKGAIDFEGMRNAASERARKRYRQFHQLIDGLPFPDSWETVLGRHSDTKEGIEEARQEYFAQPVMAVLRKDDYFRWETDISRYTVTEAEFVQKACDRAILCFAFVKDSKWYERGEMGWFACVTNEKPLGEWKQEFTQMLESLSDSTLLSVYDCHI